MIEKEQRDVYNALDQNTVTVQTKKYPMQTCDYRTETEYSFGGCVITHTVYVPAVGSRPQFSIHNRNKQFSENADYLQKNINLNQIYILADFTMKQSRLCVLRKNRVPDLQLHQTNT